MSDFEARIAALSPEKRALFERLLRQRSPHDSAEQEAYVAPRTRIEQILASTWEEVLGVQRIGIHDRFFELGGDSIHGIQVVAKARQAGLEVSHQQIFEHPTIAELAPHVRPAGDAAASQEPIEGPVPLTPMQRWLFGLPLANHAHWNQAVLLEVPQSVSTSHLREAGDAVVRHHDALRLRFERDADGWRQRYVAPEPVALDEHDLSGLPAVRRAQEIEQRSACAQAGFDLGSGPLFRLVLFRLGDEAPSRLLLVAHHLVVDGVSFRVILEDLQRALDQRRAGRKIVLPLKTRSFQEWAEYGLRQVTERDTERELEPWTTLGAHQPLPADHQQGPNVESSAETITVALDERETRALQRAAAACGATLLHALLGAIAAAYRDAFERSSVLIDLEGHGRDLGAGTPDVSRTVGWFTCLFPVALGCDPDEPWPAALDRSRASLQPIVSRAPWFGWLRDLGTPSTRARLARVARSDVMVNYLGQFGQLESGTMFRLAAEQPGPLFDPAGERPHVWQIVGGIFSGALRLQCLYSHNLHRAETVERFMACVVSVLRAAVAQDDTGTTPPRATVDPDVSADDLARLTTVHEE